MLTQSQAYPLIMTPKRSERSDSKELFARLTKQLETEAKALAYARSEAEMNDLRKRLEVAEKRAWEAEATAQNLSLEKLVVQRELEEANTRLEKQVKEKSDELKQTKIKLISKTAHCDSLQQVIDNASTHLLGARSQDAMGMEGTEDQPAKRTRIA